MTLQADPAPFIRAIRIDPLDEEQRLIYADWLEEHGGLEWAAILRQGRIPLSGVDNHLLGVMSGFRFLPGIFDKRFIMDMASMAAAVIPLKGVTPKQYRLIWRLVWKYRRQFPNGGGSLVTEAKRIWTSRLMNEKPKESPEPGTLFP